MRLCLMFMIAASACTSHVDLTGNYSIQSETASASGCNNDTPVTPTPAGLMIKEESFLGATLVVVYNCSTADPGSCTDEIGLLEEPTDNGWNGETSVSSGGGTSPCSLFYTRATATIEGSSLTFEAFEYGQQNLSLDASSCTPKEATNRGTSMPCQSHTKVTATRL